MDRKQAHVDWQQLSIRLLLTLIVPVGIALLLDWLLTTSPVITMVVGLICIPLATVVVVRAALSELDRVIAEVALPDQTVDEIQNVEGDGLPDASA
jgi:F0F1-type ATP synthase assembly protein I